MKIKMLRTDGGFEKGEILDVNETVANSLLTKGAAIRIKKSVDAKSQPIPKTNKAKK